MTTAKELRGAHQQQLTGPTMAAQPTPGITSALQEERGARVDRGAGVPFDHHVLDVVPGQEQRRGQADQAATNDQDRNLDIAM